MLIFFICFPGDIEFVTSNNNIISERLKWQRMASKLLFAFSL